MRMLRWACRFGFWFWQRTRVRAGGGCRKLTGSSPSANRAAPAEPKQSAAPSLPATLSNQQIKELVQKSPKGCREREEAARLHYSERQEQRKLDGKGEVTSTETKTFDVLQIYGEQVYRLVSKDDRPLSEKDAGKQEEKIQKIIDKRNNESDSERKKRLKKEERNGKRSASL